MEQFRALLAQTCPLDEIIVVDNGSTDGSREMLQQQCPPPTLLPLAENLGIGAAYAVGLKYALEKGHDWIWLFDHDSQPSPDALEKLLEAFVELAPTHNIGILSCLPVHRETGTEYHGLVWRDRFYSARECISVAGDYFADSVVSSGSLVRADAVRAAGPPRGDFFIDYVDHEFNLRLRRHGYEIAVIRQSVLFHRIGHPQHVKFGRRNWIRPQEPTWRVYYAARNQTITVWHVIGGFWARVYLLLDMLKHVGGILLWDPDKGSPPRTTAT
jgi:rhamnosyltransferase